MVALPTSLTSSFLVTRKRNSLPCFSRPLLPPLIVHFVRKAAAVSHLLFILRYEFSSHSSYCTKFPFATTDILKFLVFLISWGSSWGRKWGRKWRGSFQPGGQHSLLPSYHCLPSSFTKWPIQTGTQTELTCLSSWRHRSLF